MGVTKNTIIGKIQRMGLTKFYPSIWTTEAVEKLTQMYLAGDTLSQIASCIAGSTRLGVAGKINRLGLERSLSIGRENKLRSNYLHKAAAARPPIKQNEKIAAVIVLLPPDCHPVDLMSLTAQSCRFPTNDGEPGWLFCGSPVTERERDDSCPYCDFHRRIAWGGRAKRPAPIKQLEASW
jgi:hypothetical protein